MMKMASEGIHTRIKRARAVIAAGVRLKQPALELKGRQQYAHTFIENAIGLYGHQLTNTARERIARLLFDATPDTGEDATADAEETTQELLDDVRKINAPVDMVPLSELDPENLYDPDNEFEEDEDEQPA